MNLRNILTGMGTGRDKLAHTEVFEGKILSEYELSTLYNHWITEKFVDIPCEDAIRNGRTHESELTEEQKKRFIELDVDEKIMSALKKQRLFGGALVFIGGSTVTNYEREARPTKRISHLTVYSQFDWQPVQSSIQKDPTKKDFGKPTLYEYRNTTDGLKVHRSHFIILEGKENMVKRDAFNKSDVDYDYYHLGFSSVQKSFEAIVNAVSSSNAIAAMIIDAKLDVVKIEGLLNLLASEDCEDKIAKRLIHLHNHKSVHRAFAIDSTEKVERVTTSMQHFPEILREFFAHLAGASNIPLTKFLGVQNKGLGTGNEGDIQNYIQLLESIQVKDLRAAYCIIDRGLGIEQDFKFNPVHNNSESVMLDQDKSFAEIIASLSNIIDDQSLIDFVNKHSRLNISSISNTQESEPQ